MKTIKQMREADAVRLAARIDNDPTPEAIEEARHTMRLYYRFVAAYQREFYTMNESRTTKAQKDEATAKKRKAYKSASEALKKYSIVICCPGLYPILDDENGANFTTGHFYY